MNRGLGFKNGVVQQSGNTAGTGLCEKIGVLLLIGYILVAITRLIVNPVDGMAG